MTMGQGLYGLPEPVLPPKPPSRWRWPRRIILGIAAVLTVSLGTLHLIGGDGDDLKASIEKYITDMTGYTAHIGKLNAAEFYPVIGIYISELTLVKGTETVARFGHINFSTAFWGAFSGSSLRTIALSDVSVKEGVFLPGEIKVERFGVDMKDPTAPHLVGHGAYAGKPVDLKLKIKTRAGLLGATYLGLEEKAPFSLRAGNIEASGFLIAKNGGRQFDFERLVTDKTTPPMNGTISFATTSSGLKFEGGVASGKSQFSYDVVYSDAEKKSHLDGSIKATQLDMRDLACDHGLLGAYNDLMKFYSPKEKPPAPDLHIDVAADHLFEHKADLGARKGVVNVTDGVLSPDTALGITDHKSLCAAGHKR